MKRLSMWAFGVTLATLSAPAGLAATAPADDRADYGVTLAIAGDQARAESVFVSMLSHTHGDARALNNLGNLRLLRGETGVALAFYDRALRADSLDPGIHLNRATALMLIGDDVRSQSAYAQGVRLAGGVQQAQELMGLPPEAQPTDRAAQKTVLDAEQIRAMLKRAAAAVPSDTSHVSNGGAAGGTTGKKPSAWRSAGPRAADGSDSSKLLYWKR